jgi:hypothetical protein
MAIKLSVNSIVLLPKHIRRRYISFSAKSDRASFVVAQNNIVQIRARQCNAQR